jgi:hypothetical protein
VNIVNFVNNVNIGKALDGMEILTTQMIDFAKRQRLVACDIHGIHDTHGIHVIHGI